MVKKQKCEFIEGNIKPVSKEIIIHTRSGDYFIYNIASYHDIDYSGKTLKKRKFYSCQIDGPENQNGEFQNLPANNLQELVKHIKKEIIPEMQIRW